MYLPQNVHALCQVDRRSGCRGLSGFRQCSIALDIRAGADPVFHVSRRNRHSSEKIEDRNRFLEVTVPYYTRSLIGPDDFGLLWHKRPPFVSRTILSYNGLSSPRLIDKMLSLIHI